MVRRLASMIRGFGDPLAATYARSYLVHKAIDLTPTHAHSLVMEPVYDSITVFERQLSFAAGGPTTLKGLSHIKGDVSLRACAATPCRRRASPPLRERPPLSPLPPVASAQVSPADYFGTYQPALEWLMQSLAEYHPTQETLIALVKRYREKCKVPGHDRT